MIRMLPHLPPPGPINLLSPSQVAWFVDGRGATPTPFMLETAVSLLERAWVQDLERREYLQVNYTVR